MNATHHQSDLTDFTRALVTDGGRGFDPLAEFDADEATVTDAWIGTYIYTSWGYGQTNSEFAQITDVSATGKTVKCRRAALDRVDTHRTSESMRPTGETYGDEFRLYVRNVADEPHFKGSYPYIDGTMDTGTRCDLFFPFDETDGENAVTRTAPNHGH